MRHDTHLHDHSGAATATAVDPVCGMTVDPDRGVHRFDHAGVTYVFCNAGCREAFAADPGRYLDRERRLAVARPAPHVPPADTEQPRAGVLYTCPMHPEIVRDRPGSCPMCGMALEPRTVTLDEEVNPELVDMARRLRIGIALAVPVVAIAMLARIVRTSASPWAPAPTSPSRAHT